MEDKKSHSLSAICKLENQENQWYNSAWIQKPENPEADGVFSGLSLKAKNQEHRCPTSKGRRRWMAQLK